MEGLFNKDNKLSFNDVITGLKEGKEYVIHSSNEDGNWNDEVFSFTKLSEFIKYIGIYDLKEILIQEINNNQKQIA